MPISKLAAVRGIKRFGVMPFYSNLSNEALSELVETLMNNARSEQEADLAITGINTDTARASSPETNRVPTPGELLVWLKAQRQDQYDSAKYEGGCCGRLVEGWTYLQFDPRTPLEDLQQFLFPSQCVNGWIQRTIWIPVKPARIHEDGSPVRQPYHYAGRCKCQPGGTICP